MSPDLQTFRSTLGLFPTGVAVIATQVEGRVHAMTANAVSSVSLNPMLVLFCPSKRSRLAGHLPTMRHFSVNFLRDEQQALSTFFAGGWTAAAPPPFRFVSDGAVPRLEGALASVGCDLYQTIDCGDHWVIIGRVSALHQGVEPHRPLVFFNGQYHSVDFSDGTAAPDFLKLTDEPAHVFYDFWRD
jgi:flavin reductase (DIM6/NTAB) family NADH-FMN oxidoreductase RutF